MKLQFNCPVCDADLKLNITESEGPCPTCQNTLQVKIQVTALEPALRAESKGRKVGSWRCSGVPHGSAPSPARA